MKNIFVALLGILSILFSMAYTLPSYTPSNEETVMPTGYPDGELQKEYIFWNGNLYTYDVVLVKNLPEDAYKIGEVVKEDTINYPDENLEASHMGLQFMQKNLVNICMLKQVIMAMNVFQLAMMPIKIEVVIQMDVLADIVKKGSR